MTLRRSSREPSVPLRLVPGEALAQEELRIRPAQLGRGLESLPGCRRVLLHAPAAQATQAQP
eukprot:8196280-Prorocentrum_lima.AAC.1